MSVNERKYLKRIIIKGKDICGGLFGVFLLRYFLLIYLYISIKSFEYVYMNL